MRLNLTYRINPFFCKRLLIICFLSFCSLRGIAQNNNSEIKHIDSLFNKLSSTIQLDSLAEFAHDLSIQFYKKQDFINAIKYAKNEVHIGLKALDSLTYKNALYNLGLFYYRNGNYYQSITTHQKVIDSFEIDKKTFSSFCELGRNFRKLGDFHQAVLYYEKGISEPKYFPNRELIINYSNLSDLYDSYDTNIKGFLEKKLNLLKKIESLNKLTNDNIYGVIDNEINFGNYYSNEEVLDFTKSKFHFNKALRLATKISDTTDIILINNNLSYLYNIVKNDSSLQYIKRGIKLSNINDPILVKLYTNLGKYYYNNGNINDALKANHKELSLLLSETIDTSYEYIPQLKNITLSINKTHTIFTLKEKAFYLLEKYKTSEQKKYLILANKVLLLTDQLLDIINKESIATNTKLFWQQEASLIYMMAIKVSYLLNDTEKAFYFMEKKKAILLLDNLSEKELRKRINISGSILEQELSIKKTISKIENDIYYADKNKIDSLKNIHNNLKIKHTDFLKSLQKKYQAYYETKMPTEIISLVAFQKTLNNKTMVLEYVLDKTDGYLMTISKSNVEIFNLKSTKDLIEKIDAFNKLISKPFATTKDELDYNNLATELYELLIPNESISKAKQLIIVPDYNLQVLSFEALKPTKNDNDYLLKKHEISYAYSLTFLNKNNSVNRKAETIIVAFAPVNFENGLTYLKNSSYEVNKLRDLFYGNYFVDSLATKQRFIENINNSKIIHLATHANGNDSVSPWIAFRNEKIYLNELYNTQNNADLVTLSACNSATGQIKEGEGVFSLARGFFYSGANSVASTLWNVDDKSTSIIVEDFYKNLKNGQSKSEALRNSKLSYLESHSLSQASPFYWASFILIGDAGIIEIDTSFSIIYYFIIGFILLIITAYYFRRRKT